MKLKQTSFFLLLLSGCASIHHGNMAVDADSADVKSKPGAPLKSGLRVSSAELVDLSSQYFGAIDFTFENTTSEWIRIKGVDVSFGNTETDKKIIFPVGQDLKVWADAAQRNSAVKAQNRAMVIAAIGTIAGAAGALSGDRSLTLAGAGVAGASGLVLSADAINHGINRTRVSAMVPDTHLFSNNFVIPPGLHTKKWVLIYTQKPEEIPVLTTALITLNFENGTAEKIRVAFRSLDTYSSNPAVSSSKRQINPISEWQKNHPGLAE
jgi:hypothetical protein